MTAIREGETQIADVSLADWETRISQADTQSLQNDLQAVAQGSENPFAGPRIEHRRADVGTRSHDGAVRQELLRILPEEFSSGAKLEADRLAERSATELHAFANIFHCLNTSNSQLMKNITANAGTLYQAAINAYEETDAVDKVLLAVARLDYSRFLADQKDYAGSAALAKQAASLVPEATLFQISLRCQLADQYRKRQGDSPNALAQLDENADSAKAWAKKMRLAPDHPLQAEMLERRAWINVDRWQMRQAIGILKRPPAFARPIRNWGTPLPGGRSCSTTRPGDGAALFGTGQNQTDKEGNTVLGSIAEYGLLIRTSKILPRIYPMAKRWNARGAFPTFTNA